MFFQALSHVTPLRNFFLKEANYPGVKRSSGDSTYLLVQRFGELMRKLWNPRNFKAHVSPHDMLQAVVLLQNNRNITNMFHYATQQDSRVRDCQVEGHELPFP